jgi:predicted HTH transcriptional regulator
VLVVAVEAGNQPPYGVNPANPRYYIRRGATTFPASSDQVRSLGRSRPPADRSDSSPFGYHGLS